MPIHIFYDNSNIWLGSGHCRAEKEPHIPGYLLRIYFKNLFSLVISGRDVATKELSGSLPPECDALWDYARENGFNTNLLYRIDDGKRIREQSVDEALHLKIANVLLDYDPPQTLVLMTGDGKQSEFGTSFYDQAERALKRKWEVELWAWRATISSRYNDLIASYQNRFRIKELDAYYNQITFVKSGRAFLPDSSEIEIPKRIVSALL